jgi:HEAT repeats
MGRLYWPLAFVLAFLVGLAAANVVPRSPMAGQEVERLRGTVSRLEQQVSALQARLRARESAPGPRQSGAGGEADPAPRSSLQAGMRPADRLAASMVMEGRVAPGRSARDGGAAQPRGGSPIDGASSTAGPRATNAPPPTVESALDRFYRYLEASNLPEGRERGQQVRQLIDDLRAMGDVGAEALMSVLQTGSDSDERRAAARLLGALQVPQALPLLRDIIDKEDDLLLRRAAAFGLRRLQTPDSVPVMERILTSPGEDRFVRLSAAYGLAESGRPLGVAGLTQIFEESAADGRGRELAFRALAALKDERALPFMRQLVTAAVEPGYRLQAMKYLTAQGDRQALAALQIVMQSPTEQPSIRDAATQAHAAISGR